MTPTKIIGLLAVLALTTGLMATGAAATNDESTIQPPAAATCLMEAQVEHTGKEPNRNAGDGLVYPTHDPHFPEAPQFEWTLTSENCEVTLDSGANVILGADLNISGTAQGWCGFSQAPGDKGEQGFQGTLETPKGQVVEIHNVNWTSAGRVMAVTFDYVIVKDNEPDTVGPGHAQVQILGEEDCDLPNPNGGANTFDVRIVAELTTSDVGDLFDQQPPDDFDEPSARCEEQGGDRIVNSTTQGVHTSVYVHQPTTDEVWLCGRIEDGVTGDGYGGRLEVTPTDPDPNIDPGESSEPDLDSNSTACTTTSGNDAPGSRPLSQGGIGPVDYMVDAYVDDDEAWLCVQAGPQDARVMVPLGAGGTPGVSIDGSAATWYPDEGTPTL